jgi:hypothetical protein
MQAAATLYDLAVDQDPPAVQLDPVGSVGHHLPPAHARIGDEQELELSPPNPPAGRGRLGEMMDAGRRRDLGLLDESASLLELLRVGVVAPSPMHAPEHILAGEEKALIEASPDHGR